ncbi:hypothetical protein AUJ66_05665 [Candidatus Desantisbacteria bacterium CG1_02_38_46]|uniref:Beta-hexosaminidase bacterial type N-terminal domain-containing protein n=2 Tax=unclassified Candidatus Desantisiibacteriota TaxID=3106372 RepID=A0A1J4SEV9_9BACT|nr:MAG: hypothetical protein AUJ66_05665 [Candidatus Desantisbacteria bacterium CG1_02_38_46]PIU52110.1 MAG: hypothetical protein COS91_00940 [Candidatus Desantisbacteria bacterium CG07_land_8_20_14_0_80_39_15]
MKIRISIALLLGISLFVRDLAGGSDMEKNWLNYLIPFPKEITISGKTEVPVDEIFLEKKGKNIEEASFVLENFNDFLKKKSGAEITSNVLKPNSFKIEFFLLSEEDIKENLVPEIKRLKNLPNSDQAYVILETKKGLQVIALTPWGLQYGFATLKQFLIPTLKEKDGKFSVTMPKMKVIDWPDLEERGLWAGYGKESIPWLSEHKLNVVERHLGLVDLFLSKEGKGIAKVNKSLIDFGYKNGVKMVPTILHLNQLYIYPGLKNLFNLFPELNYSKGDFTWRNPPCASSPKLIDLLADWLSDIASTPKVTDISVWLSEEGGECTCPECKKLGQYATEAKAIVTAWYKIKEKYPKCHLRILLTQGSYPVNDKVISVVPKDVYVSYYDGGKTYRSNPTPMIYPLLENYAKEGRWLGVYPQFSPSWRIVCPWHGPQFIKYRMEEFIEKGLKNVAGYIVPYSISFYEFNLAAVAEWSWNLKGRSEEEFALAYATRKGYQNPEKFAKLVTQTGKITWKVYGADIPFPWFFSGKFSGALGGGTLKFGQGPLANYTSLKEMKDDLIILENCKKSVQELETKDLSFEISLIEGYLKLLKYGVELQEMINKESVVSSKEEEKKKLFESIVKDLEEIKKEVTLPLEQWYDLKRIKKPTDRFLDTIEAGKSVAEEMFNILPFIFQTAVIENAEVPIKVPSGKGIKIGVYCGGYGTEGITKALEKQGFVVFSLPRINLETLNYADVVIVPQRRSNWVYFNVGTKDLRKYVEKGGNVILLHDGAGYRDHKISFPEVGKGIIHPKPNMDVVKIIKTHPITEGFNMGDTFVHAYADHIAIEKGHKGEVLVEDEKGNPVIVIGKLGKGKVVLNGMVTGYASKIRGDFTGEEKEPEGGELKILLNTIKWLGEKATEKEKTTIIEDFEGGAGEISERVKKGRDCSPEFPELTEYFAVSGKSALKFEVATQNIDTFYPPYFQIFPSLTNWKDYNTLRFHIFILPSSSSIIMAGMILEPYSIDLVKNPNNYTIGTTFEVFSFNVPTKKPVVVSIPIDKVKFKDKVGALLFCVTTATGNYFIDKVELSDEKTESISAEFVSLPKKVLLPD